MLLRNSGTRDLSKEADRLSQPRTVLLLALGNATALPRRQNRAEKGKHSLMQLTEKEMREQEEAKNKKASKK